MVTSRDVARQAGVSQATVSRVLNNNPTVGEATRRRVEQALTEIGYVPNAPAAAMRRGKSGVVGIVANEIQNPFFPYLLDELTRAARKRDVNITVWNDDRMDVPTAIAGARGGFVDGVLFTAIRTTTTGVRDLVERGVPVMLCNRAPDAPIADAVTTDHYGSGYSAGEYFSRHGRTSIAAVFGPPTTFASPARERGFRAALADAGISLRAANIYSGETTYATGQQAAKRILDRDRAVDAVFCSSDVIAYGVLDTLREHGARVPDDLWVVGIDGLPMSGWRAFDLTTQEQRIAQIAESAMSRLLERIGGSSGAPERLVVPTDWAVRGSSGGVPQHLSPH